MLESSSVRAQDGESMKFLDFEKLSALTEALTLREVGDKVLNGRIEAYSCESGLGVGA
jgi:hypothetical protein